MTRETLLDKETEFENLKKENRKLIAVKDSLLDAEVRTDSKLSMNDVLESDRRNDYGSNWRHSSSA